MAVDILFFFLVLLKVLSSPLNRIEMFIGAPDRFKRGTLPRLFDYYVFLSQKKKKNGMIKIPLPNALSL